VLLLAAARPRSQRQRIHVAHRLDRRWTAQPGSVRIQPADTGRTYYYYM
jgi:hypothetical protein